MPEKQEQPSRVTDIKSVEENANAAVYAFTEQWEPMPEFAVGVEVMDVRQLRNAMGLRATMDWGDPWPSAERMLLAQGFRWHMLGSQRVMFLREKNGFIPDTGWVEPEEYQE